MTDKVLMQIANMASRCDKIQKILLFGSRARNQHTLSSDYDFALFTEMSLLEQQKFIYQAEEGIETLLEFDFIFVDKNTDKCLLAEIDKDGVVIYEKS